MLVERFLPLARALARRYQHTGEPVDDLFQVACLGLLKAIDRFDLSRDVAFSSYAVPTMVGEIRRYLRDRTWSVQAAVGIGVDAVVEEPLQAGDVLEVELVVDQVLEPGHVEHVEEGGVGLLTGVVEGVLVALGAPVE